MEEIPGHIDQPRVDPDRSKNSDASGLNSRQDGHFI
jgi:hypothetical protein